MREKRILKDLLLFLTLSLMVLPFLVSFNEAITRLVEKFRLYVLVQERVVPLEVRMVGVLVKPLGINYLAHREGLTVNGTYARMTWNCIGWQSLLLLIVSLAVGLRGGYTRWSKIEAAMIGLLGTFLVNLFRLALIIVLLGVSRPLFAVVFHDYLAAIMTVFWLFGFWWFAYGFVLEPSEKLSGRSSAKREGSLVG